MEVGDSFEAGGRSYEIVEKLGEGGYATAYKAKQRRPIGKLVKVSTVVVKVPSEYIMSNPANVHRWVRVSLAVITRLSGQDLWRLAFYERDGGRLRFSSSVECCWESVGIILRTRAQNISRAEVSST